MIYAIGDVHGEYELLMAIHERLDARLAEIDAGASDLVVHLGDLIDRGPRSIACLRAALNWKHPSCRSLVLPGNHEQMLMAFWNSVLTGQSKSLQRQSLRLWLHNGGWAVCDELGIDDDPSISEVVSAFEQAGVPVLLEQLSGSPAAVRAGAYLFVHAGIPCKPGSDCGQFVHPDDVPGMDWRSENPNDPAFDPQASPLWIREPFLDYPGFWPDGVTVIHGHTISLNRPEKMPNRIGIDTGACMGGSLTMLEIDGTRTRAYSVLKSAER